MAHTFKLRAREPDGQRLVEYLDCPPAEVVARARALLNKSHATEIEVWMGEQYMFTVDHAVSLQFK